MPTYNDPAMAAAFSNLGKLFAPPSPQEMLYAAKAAQARGETDRAARLFNMAITPGTDRNVLDQAAIAAGNYNPSQSYYAVGVDDATKRRGQDVTAKTTLDTNAADNARAVATNAADNNRAMAVARYGALNKDQSLPAMPASVGGQYGLPESGPVMGVISTNPGDKVYGPDGKIYQGNAKPLTETEAKAARFSGLPGWLQDVVTIGNTPTTTVLGKNGGTREMYTAQAVEQGTPTYQAPRANADVMNYTTADGKSGTAVYDGATLRDTQTGEKLPPNIRTYKAQAQGTPGELGKPTEASDKAAGFSIRGGSANDALNALYGKQDGQPDPTAYRPSYIGWEALQGSGKSLPLQSVVNTVAGATDPHAQEAAQAGENFLNSILRPDTGAAFSNQEKDDYGKTFLPRPGDSEAVIAAKKQARDIAVTVTAGLSRGGAMQLAGDLQRLGLPVPSLLTKNLKVSNAQGQGGPAVGPGPAAQAGPAPAPQAGPTPQAAPAQAPAVPPRAIEALRANPAMADEFDRKFGPGAAAQVLGNGGR